MRLAQEYRRIWKRRVMVVVMAKADSERRRAKCNTYLHVTYEEDDPSCNLGGVVAGEEDVEGLHDFGRFAVTEGGDADLFAAIQL
jgi:hypothetical protein